MFILVPPSEGKTAPVDGPPLDLENLSHPELNAARKQVLGALMQASHGGPEAINAPPSTASQVAANTRLWEAPTAPAAQVYTGVLFAAAGLADLHGPQAERADAHVRIASTLFGFLRPQDRIPAYRLPPAAKLPGIGAPLAHLSSATTAVMTQQGTRLVIDCRSGPYQRLWRPTCPVVEVKAYEWRAGKRVVVSHFAKHHRGVLTRHLLTRTQDLPVRPEGVLQAAQDLQGEHYSQVDMIQTAQDAYALELYL